MKTKLKKLMAGRNGNDELSLMMLLTAGICLLFAFISRNRTAAFVFVIILVILVIWSLFRMFSRNIPQREKENRIYKDLTGGFSKKSLPFRESMAEWWKNIRSIKLTGGKKTYGLKANLFKCPGCGINVKVPANKGRVMVTCPKCGKIFERMS